MKPTVRADSLVTLNYRLATADGVELVSTFDAFPATLQLGAGELAPPLEACLIGMEAGRREVFHLPPGQGFGERNPDLLQRLPRSQVPAGQIPEVGSPIQFPGPGSSSLTALVRDLDEAFVLVDFNHPLAGSAVCFEAEIVGVL